MISYHFYPTHSLSSCRTTRQSTDGYAVACYNGFLFCRSAMFLTWAEMQASGTRFEGLACKFKSQYFFRDVYLDQIMGPVVSWHDDWPEHMCRAHVRLHRCCTACTEPQSCTRCRGGRGRRSRRAPVLGALAVRADVKRELWRRSSSRTSSTSTRTCWTCARRRTTSSWGHPARVIKWFTAMAGRWFTKD